MSPPRPPLAVTAGEPGGIGPDLMIRLAHDERARGCVVFADPGHLRARAGLLGVAVEIRELPADGWERQWEPSPEGVLAVVAAVTGEPAATPGVAQGLHARGVLACIDAASRACREGRVPALVTGPVEKRTLLDAGYAFRGHTEHLAAAAGCPVVMMLQASSLRVALATTHLPLRDVPAALSRESLDLVLEILVRELGGILGRPPVIRVLGFNPHAGEGGHLGCEERDIIGPAVEEYRARSVPIEGPVSADTAFVEREGVDCFLAMYHDQGLPVLKTLGFGHAVNVTLGLPYVRTSVDHGTALEIAATGDADPGSLFAAIDCARELLASRAGR